MIHEFLEIYNQEYVRFFITITGILISIIVILYRTPRYIKQITFWISNYYYKIYNKQKVKTDIQKILEQASIAVSIYDEIIGFFQSTHVGIYSFHNGDVSLDNIHLYKLSMIDERSRYYTLIQQNRELSANIFIEILNKCKKNDYYELDKHTTPVIFIKEQLATLESINYVYWTVQWEDDIPSFALTISTKNKLSESKVKEILKYRLMLHQIYNNSLEPITHELLKR
jgi:hypothetical protein